MNEKNTHKTLSEALIEKGTKIAVAESCTGGLISAKLTSIPGSSTYFDRGFVTYSNLAKIQLLGVSEETINNHGAVSEETAKEMALGALENSSADIALAVTGIAGPSGGTDGKPVGTVFIALASGDDVDVQRFLFSGDRDEVREQTSQAALDMACKYLKNKS